MTALVDVIRRCRIYDASPEITADMPVFPGHPRVAVDHARTHQEDGYFLQTVQLGEHAGSHVDAPAHALADRPQETIDTFPVSRFVAPYVVVDLASLQLTPGMLATRADLIAALDRHALAIQRGDAALLRFGWDDYYAEPDAWWAANTPGLAADACAFLADLGVSLVGSDTPTCDTAVREGRIVADHGHRTYFLPKGILLVEGLLGLGGVPRCGVIVAAPLKISGGSGAPARVLLIAEENQ